MDIAGLILNADNLRTLLLLVAIIAGVVWVDKKGDRKLDGMGARIDVLSARVDGLAAALRQEMADLAATLRKEMDALAAALRREMDERFDALQRYVDERFAYVDERFARMDERFARMDERFAQMDARFDNLRNELRDELGGRFVAFHMLLKTNDFAHLHEAIKALTFTLVKNNILKPEDKVFVDEKLDDKQGLVGGDLRAISFFGGSEPTQTHKK